MRKLRELDQIVGEACGAVAEAASDTSSLEGESAAIAKRKLADALMKLWDVRDLVHAQDPSLANRSAQVK